VESKNCRKEIFLAVDESKPIVSIYVEKTIFPASLKLQIGSCHAIMKYQLERALYLEKLQKTIAHWNVANAFAVILASSVWVVARGIFDRSKPGLTLLNPERDIFYLPRARTDSVVFKNGVCMALLPRPSARQGCAPQ
jgi:hypothetical protein